jgi:hypothetical protein
VRFIVKHPRRDEVKVELPWETKETLKQMAWAGFVGAVGFFIWSAVANKQTEIETTPES